MPPQWLRYLIVLFWLATTGWLFWHDLWPNWRPGEPPLFHVDFVEEVRHKDSVPQRNNWIVQRQKDGESKPYPVFDATTWVENDDEDVYSLNANLDARKDPKYQPVKVAEFFTIDRINSAYRVNRVGQLLSLESTVQLHFNPELSLLHHLFLKRPKPAPNGLRTEKIHLRIWGEVRERRFYARCRVELASLGKPMQLDLPAVDVSYTGSVLMPLHPLSHIRGLRQGQSWRQPLVDPLRDALASVPGFSGGVRWLNAHVLPRPQMLEQDGSATSCLMIEYTNDENEVMGRTWVEWDGERVLQQEAILDDGRWIMKREPARRRRAPIVDPQHD